MGVPHDDIPLWLAHAESIWPEFEPRPQQAAMAEAVLEALRSRSSLAVEAPTGVGKTLAYLLPAMIVALRDERKALLSTHTKNLQDQIISKDVPMLRRLLGVDFPAVILKGRRNYLCTSRLDAAIASRGTLFTTKEAEELERIRAWADTTPDGDIENLGFVPLPSVWDLVASDPGFCNPRNCPSGCFYRRIREQARHAALVIVNHALFFQLLARNDDDAFMLEGDFVILDEAHTLEGTAASALGLRVARASLLALLNRLHNPTHRRGLLIKAKKSVKDLCRATREEVQEFFDHAARAARASAPNARGGEFRVRRNHLTADTVTPLLQRLSDAVRTLADDDQTPFPADLLVIAGALEEAADGIVRFLEQGEEDCAYWVENETHRDANIVLRASPINVGSVIGPKLFDGNHSVILTSATLAVSGSAEYFLNCIGAGATPFVQMDSPFQHSRQMRLCLAPAIPEPDNPSYAEALPGWILHAIDRTHGRALVLFTNATLLASVASALEAGLADRNIRLLAQRRGLSRHALINEFRSDTDSVLLGLESFWMGVDVPGDALQHVIVTKLPFAVPTHPFIEARLEAITARGGSAFMEYALPEAVLKFRQGVGRLIRSINDTGIVTVLDSRVVRKSYGRLFLSSIPRCPVDRMDPDGSIEEMQMDDW